MLKKLFGSITIGGIIAAVGGYVIPHIDPSAVGPTLAPILSGLLGVIAGVLTHHVNTGTSS